MSVAVVQFPGSNGDWDALHALHGLGVPARFVFHKEHDLGASHAVLIPGGFSYGDYLRAGAIAAQSPIIPAIRRFADQGGPVLGICNGFQILTEVKLLPGVLLPNEGRHFVCQAQPIRVETLGFFSSELAQHQILNLPIAHAEGRYYCDAETLQQLHQQERIAFRYADQNPNGSLDDIAGIYSENKKVLGLMPHPERGAEGHLGFGDGALLLRAFLRVFAKGVFAKGVF